MTSNTVHVSTFSKGMNLDMDEAILPAESYRHSTNIRILCNEDGTALALLSTEGLKQCKTKFDSTVKIIGVCVVSDIAVVFTRTIDGIDHDTDKKRFYNTIFRIFNAGQPDEKCETIIKGRLGLCAPENEIQVLSLSPIREREDIVKVYFTDGNSCIKVIDVLSDRYLDRELKDDYGMVKPGVLDINIDAELDILKFSKYGQGLLKCGMYQYAYQFFNVHSQISAISPFSALIPVFNTTTGTQDTNYSTDVTDKSIVLKAKLNQKNLDYFRVIRLYYKTNNSIPEISVAGEYKINEGDEEILFVDNNEVLSDLTIAELDAYRTNLFNAATIRSVKNRLFAANIQETTYDIGDFDTRSYRFDANGNCLLLMANGDKLEFEKRDLKNGLVPLEHDCICPTNIDRFDNPDIEKSFSTKSYLFGINNKTYGGYGINIDYEFVVTDVELTGDLVYSVDLNKNKNKYNTFTTRNVVSYQAEAEIRFVKRLEEENYADFSNPFFCENYVGYKRNEIYRFGIIFYNSKGIASPVSWIADILMPSNGQCPAFTMHDELNNVFVGHTLGLNFMVKNLPEGATSYEIVRCHRGSSDRSVVFQCHAASTGNEEKINTGSGGSKKTNRYVPFVYPTFGDHNGTGSDYGLGFERKTITKKPIKDNQYETEVESFTPPEKLDSWLSDNHYKVDGRILRLFSPEISVQRESSKFLVDRTTFGYRVGVSDVGIATSGGNQRINTAFIPNSWQGYANYLSRGDHQKHLFDGNKFSGYFNPILMKFFDVDYYNYGSKPSIADITDCEYGRDIPFNKLEELDSYRVSVGEYVVTNISTSNSKELEDEEDILARGPAGPSLYAAFKSEEDGRKLFGNAGMSTSIIDICRNVVQYGGNSYNARFNSVYISTGSTVTAVNKNVVNTMVYGGDTFTAIFKYPYTMIFQMNEADKYDYAKNFVGLYLPIETSMNLSLATGDDFVSRSEVIDKAKNYEMVNGLCYNDPILTNDCNILNQPFLEYNTAYSVQDNVNKFVPKARFSKSNQLLFNRIMWSEAKTNGEVFDLWCVFKPANYYDADIKYGKITNIVDFKNSFLIFLDSAVGQAAINLRETITSETGKLIVLGTGTFLQDLNYLTVKNGSSIINDKSIIVGGSALYWYDKDKNVLCHYSGSDVIYLKGSVIELSKKAYIQSLLNSNKDKYKDSNINSLYDPKYLEVWFKLNDLTIVYNETLGAFTSFYSYYPEFTLPFSDRTLLINGNLLYTINDDDKSGFGDRAKNSTIMLVVNKEPVITKVFDNVRFQGDFLDKNNDSNKNFLISSEFKTKHLYSFKLNSDLPIDYREDTYRFAIPRSDKNVDPMTLPQRMRGKYLICLYTFDTTDGKTFKIPAIITTFRQSKL